jgi:hypothetical protein
VTSLRLTLCLLVVGIVAAFPAAAAADQPVSPTYDAAGSLDKAPPGFTTTGNEAKAIAERTQIVKDAKAKHPDLLVAAFVEGNHWSIDFYRGRYVRAEVLVSGDGRVLGAWKGLAARTYYSRGHFGAIFDHVWVWLPFGILFLVPFVDPRNWRRLIHLDLAVLLSFGVSYAFFTNVHPEIAVWLFYPVLGYLLARMLWVGFKGWKPSGRLVPLLPTTALLIGLLVMIPARVALNIAEPKTMDVAYASVVGANRIEHKAPLYVDNDQHGDTYGPLNYIAYVPFELIFPYDGKWDSLPSAHAASIFFDLMTILGLFLLGRRMRAGPAGKRLGLALAWGWAAFPFTVFNLVQNVNDGLVAMLVVYTLLALKSAPARGALLGAAAAAKFMPGGLLPLIAIGAGKRSKRDALIAAGSCIAIFAFAVALYMPDGGVKEFWNCTMGFQLGRLPDFSLWGVVENIGWTQKLVELGAFALALAVAFVPRGDRTPVQVAALTAAVTIALQLPAGHWFYFYIVWFLPALLVALFAAHDEPAGEAAEPALEAEPDFPTHRFERDLAGA